MISSLFRKFAFVREDADLLPRGRLDLRCSDEAGLLWHRLNLLDTFCVLVADLVSSLVRSQRPCHVITVQPDPPIRNLRRASKTHWITFLKGGDAG